MNFEQYKEIQGIAKKVHFELEALITSNSTETSIAKQATLLMSDYGIKETWYHNVPAFVLLGSRSCLSISGKDYTPSNEEVGEFNLVTVDLSPMKDKIWGDCARSFVVENGVVSNNPSNEEFAHGISTERKLHIEMKGFVKPTTRFSELYTFGNDLIRQYGYENLDFLSNLGHSIETVANQRRFVDSGCSEELGNVMFFTFEPHIKRSSGSWGFKHEEVYSFNKGGELSVL